MVLSINLNKGGSIMLKKELMDKLSTSPSPYEWLISFHWQCQETAKGNISCVRLLQHLLCMGPTGEGDPCADFNRMMMSEYLPASKYPYNYSKMIYNYLKEFGLIKKMRRCVIDDFYKDEEVCDVDKAYALWLLASFLKN
jgi:hypothetical protein